MYVPTKDNAWKLYHHLQKESANKDFVGMYHANLTSNTKLAVYSDFRRIDSSLRCLVATVAFGMVCDYTYIVIIIQ